MQTHFKPDNFYLSMDAEQRLAEFRRDYYAYMYNRRTAQNTQENPYEAVYKKRPTLRLEFQGKFVAAAIRYEHDLPPKRGKRGHITTFSKQSRTRLFDLFHRLEIKQKPIFLTLTYGEDYPDAKTAKSHLRAFLERIRRIPGGKSVSAVWRMEFQKRGAPHFHVLFFGLPFIKKEAIQRAWGQITRTDRPITRIEQVRSHKSLMAYVSKYVAKIEPSEDSGFNSLSYLHAYQAKHGENIGRVWGCFNKDSLPFAERWYYERDLDMVEYAKFHDLAISVYPPIADYLSAGFRLYVKDAERWKDIARYLFDGKPPPLTI